MTTLASAQPPGLAALEAAAAAAGLAVSSSAAWPRADDPAGAPAPLAGFIDSNFSPLVAEVAGRALTRARGEPSASSPVTAIVLVTALGDVTSAARVAAAVDAGARVPPLHFFQSVPNAVAGYLAARWHLTGPVVCVNSAAAGLDVAALLIDDADADEALVVRIDLAVTEADRDSAVAILVTGPASRERTRTA
jgi:Beta-ketoacyl synthase, N-terminal domain